MSASPDVDEIIGAKNEQVAAAAAVVSRLSEGLDTSLAAARPSDSHTIHAQRTTWIELLRLAPKGLRFDQPTVDVLRNRLTALAHVVAAAIDAA